MFPIIGFLLLIGFLFAALVLCGIVWAFVNLALGISYLIRGPGRNAKLAGARWHPPPVRRGGPASAWPPAVPQTRVPGRPAVQASPEIWPKWTAAHRRYVDEERALWQEQFDRLDSRR